MPKLRRCTTFVLAVALLVGRLAAQAPEKPTQKPFEPEIGQAGKDVVWVPTPPDLVEKMLDMAQVTADDYVIDLGSGDGRNIIAAARRGARALGVEFNADMVALSNYNAKAAGVSEKARFVEGDMYAADISEATVLALFLLPSNMSQLRDKFFDLRPGSRIVVNTFQIPEWQPDDTAGVGGACDTWCTAHLWIVPAKVGGIWQMPQGALTLEQNFQFVSGRLAAAASTDPVVNGRLRGAQITFGIGNALYAGTVNGNRIEGTVTMGGATTPWAATRAN